MPNGERRNLAINAIFYLDDVDRGKWHIETARHLRFFADQIETNGLNRSTGNIFGSVTSETSEPGHGRGYCEYVEQ